MGRRFWFQVTFFFFLLGMISWAPVIFIGSKWYFALIGHALGFSMILLAAIHSAQTRRKYDQIFQNIKARGFKITSAELDALDPNHKRLPQ